LLEHNGALFVADDGIAQIPFDLVEWIGACRREKSRKLKAGGGLRLAAACGLTVSKNGVSADPLCFGTRFDSDSFVRRREVPGD
jgi:hypothetical protein